MQEYIYCSNFKKKERIGKFVSTLMKDSSFDKSTKHHKEVSLYTIIVSRVPQLLKTQIEV
jgi:uncharacterized protein YozE (UPF0346 family)